MKKTITLKEANALMDGICYTLCKFTNVEEVTKEVYREILTQTRNIFQQYCDENGIIKVKKG